MSEAEVLDLALARAAWRAAVVVQLGAGDVRPTWSRTPLPAITNLESLHHAVAFAHVDRVRLLHNDSAPTALELADGNWGPAVRRLAGSTAMPDSTIARLAAAFDQHLAPSCMRPRTRADYWRAWRLVVTWAVARRAVPDILPMSLVTLKALTWDLVCFAVPTSQIELVWKAVQARHRQLHLRPPMTDIGQSTRWSRMLGMIRGRPAALKLPIQKATVRWLLAWRPASFVEHRARLLTVVATLACLRVSEVTRLQVCDLWFDHLMAYGVPGFEGTCSVHIGQRKNDAERKGHYPALGRAKDPSLDIVAQLRVWMRTTGLSVHATCQKRRRPEARCDVCPPLFPLSRRVRGELAVDLSRPCNRQRASDWIRQAVAQAGGDSTRFSGISARKGGISVAIDAGVPEAILYLQSGHGQALPARAYMQLSSPARFLETFEAFGL